MIRKGYSDGPFGQLHWRVAEPDRPASHPDLYCLHPGPYSGIAFTGIMPHLAKDRRVIAPDYPGFGGSDPFKADPVIAEYGEAMFAVIADISDDRPVDLMGFHTGTLVAAEMALMAPDKVGQLALVDIPAFDAETSARYHAMAAQPFDITPEMNCLEKPWKRGITNRIDSQGPDRSFEMFTEQLRPGRHMHCAFHAAFTYDVYGRLPQVQHPTLALATQSELLDATRWAGQNMPPAKLVERLDINRAVLDEAAETIASEIIQFLSEDPS
ncbi:MULTISPECIES: alpha/beta hydrolase [Sphingomonadales]|uniref:alpha/beta fold hydrolase n=1 Tax=Sphingomonadales TaxID=204457 RepID=UPI0032666C8E